MKKTLVLMLALVLAVALFAGCSNTPAPAESTKPSGPAAPESQAPVAENYKVYLITMDQMDQHWKNVDAGCKQAATELGNVDYTWLAPDVKDDAKQIECINNAVAGGADAILLAANGPDAVTAALQEATAAGVTIVYVDSAANYDKAVATLATDNKDAGKTAGTQMLNALTAAGVTEGKIGVISVNAATASTVNREAGFREAFAGTKFEILETTYSDGDAARSKDIAANYITQGCVGIFGANEGCTVGTGNAIKEAGTSVIGVGFDKSDTILSLVKDGFLLCTMAQNPDVMGYKGMQTAVAALSGQSFEKNVNTGVTVLDKSKVQ